MASNLQSDGRASGTFSSKCSRTYRDEGFTKFIHRAISSTWCFGSPTPPFRFNNDAVEDLHPALP